MPAQSHHSDPRILGRRTLEQDHRCLAELLHPGLSVLDVGCDIGSITAGIAQTVRPEGLVLGVDRDEALLEMARREYAGIENLQFEYGDATARKSRARFDIVTSARALQWIAEPRLAVENRKLAAKPGDMVVVLDYTHTQNGWEPEPPPEFKIFYDSFLAWQRANSWDNEIADHLPGFFRSTGLTSVRGYSQNEVVKRGESEFASRSFSWTGTLEHVAGQLVAAGLCTAAQLKDARERYESWGSTGLVRRTLALRTTIGVVP